METFPALTAIAGVRHGFTGRVPGLEVKLERRAALAQLKTLHQEALARAGLADHIFITAEQVHGSELTVVDAQTPSPVAHTDGLLTTDPRVCLGIHVADCGPVFIVDPVRRVLALLHSGRQGTELGITTLAVEKMQRVFGCAPANLVLQLGPCIRPPLYETDFASAILEQAYAAGVRAVHDCEICTGTQVDRYYSYRVERGKTGRLLAFLAFTGA